MKNNLRKIYWPIIMITAILASIFALGYGIFFKQDIAIEEQGFATILWNVSYWATVAFMVVGIIMALYFAFSQIVKGLIESPKGQIEILMAVGLLVLVFIVSWILASGTDIPAQLFEKTGSDMKFSKLIGGSLYTCYVLIIGVVLTVLATEIAKKIK